MPFPPTDHPAPVNKTNATAQVNDHPEHHNVLAQNLNDTVEQLIVERGRITSNTQAISTKADSSRVDALETEIDANTAHRVNGWSSSSSLGAFFLAPTTNRGSVPRYDFESGATLNYRVLHGRCEIAFRARLSTTAAPPSAELYFHYPLALPVRRGVAHELARGGWRGATGNAGIVLMQSNECFRLHQADGSFLTSGFPANQLLWLDVSFAVADGTPDAP